MTQSILNYAQEKTLLIPESLYQMDDAHCVMGDNDAAIFYKNIPNNMQDIEFFTNTACLAYVLSGKESFSSFVCDEINLNPAQMLFMPKNSFMVSDFIRTDGPLEAFLFFFDDQVIKEFMKNKLYEVENENKPIAAYKLEADDMVTAYMEALQNVYTKAKTTPDLLRLKLLELLNILDVVDENKKLRQFLKSNSTATPKRNIKRLLSDPCYQKLSVQDLAVLSGRSASSFNRDFKRQFGTTPQKWLTTTRMERAFELLRSSEMSVSEISTDIGYDNISHFISIFKKQYQISPKKMRQERNW